MYLGVLSRRRHMGFDETERQDSRGRIFKPVDRIRHTLNEREKYKQRVLKCPKIDSEHQIVYPDDEEPGLEGDQSPTSSRNSNTESDNNDDEEIGLGTVRRTDTEMRIGLDLPPNGHTSSALESRPSSHLFRRTTK